MKKCDCKIMNTLSRYPKVWPWLGVAGYAHRRRGGSCSSTRRWGKMHTTRLRMLVHGAGAGLLCLGAGVHTAQAAAAGMVRCPRRRDRRRSSAPASSG